MNAGVNPSETRAAFWRRVLRPLHWWLVLVLVMLAIHQHQLAMERTRIKFTVTMYGTNLLMDAEAALDGQPVLSGQKISLGSHTLVITHRKGEPFTTNFFAWYGGLDCGKVNLTRATGFLNISAKPAARSITITGSEYSQTLNDSKGINIMVPTDVYYIRCEYARWNKEGSWTVNRGNNEVCVFDPQLGDLSLTSSDLPATYQVTDQKGRLMEQGDLPATVTGLPSGLYQVSVQHSGHRLNRNVFVAQDRVNPLAVKFAFGAVRLESQPAGAAVYAGGNYLGATPLVVRELDPGPVTFQIQARGYADAGVSAFVLADETITAGTNLLSLNYVQAMQSARNNLAAGDYHGAVTALEQALAAKPDDTEALQLQPIARGHEYIQTAAELAAQDDFIGAGEKLKPALALLPDDAEAKKLQAEYLKHVPEQVARMKEEQTHKAFRMVCEASPGSRYFDSNQIKCGARTPEEMRDAILRTFNSEMPTFKVVQNLTVTDGIYALQMLQGAEIPLSTMRRQLLMVIGTGDDGRTVVYYKVNEYQKKAALTVNITLNSIDTGERPEDWIPVHPSRIRMTPILSNQIATGVHMADRLIRLAAGLTPAE